MATIQLRLSEQEAEAVRCAIDVRLVGIRGYGLSEEEHLRNVSDRLAKNLNK